MQCRYCLETNGVLIYPCSCKTPVHYKCLQKWKSIRKSPHCEICLAEWPKPPKRWPLYLFLSILVVHMFDLYNILLQTAILFFSFSTLGTIFIGVATFVFSFWHYPVIVVGTYSMIHHMFYFLYKWFIMPLLLLMYTNTSLNIVTRVMNKTECLLNKTNMTECFQK